MALVTGVDFAYIPTKNFEAAKQFYGGVLGLEQSKQYGSRPGGEFETGNLTLQILRARRIRHGVPAEPQPDRAARRGRRGGAQRAREPVA